GFQVHDYPANGSQRCIVDRLWGYPAAWGMALTKKAGEVDRKSTRLNSSHVKISYAVFCLKKKTNLLKFIRDSIKMIRVYNLQSFIASMTQKLTLSDFPYTTLFRSVVSRSTTTQRTAASAVSSIGCGGIPQRGAWR